MEIGICSAILNFNGGAMGFSKIFEELHLDTGEFTKIIVQTTMNFKKWK